MGRHVIKHVLGCEDKSWVVRVLTRDPSSTDPLTGAALACPDRRVICLQADGSAMYTMQALWTQAREGLNVTSVILSNRAYAILFREYANVSAAQPTKNAHDLMELRRPEIDWVLGESAWSAGREGNRSGRIR
jgi:TPP-dependent trihydroxycyclohexane-1,2-dione (THcHDO) dehydratase